MTKRKKVLQHIKKGTVRFTILEYSRTCGIHFFSILWKEFLSSPYTFRQNFSFFCSSWKKKLARLTVLNSYRTTEKLVTKVLLVFEVQKYTVISHRLMSLIIKRVGVRHRNHKIYCPIRTGHISPKKSEVKKNLAKSRFLTY